MTKKWSARTGPRTARQRRARFQSLKGMISLEPRWMLTAAVFQAVQNLTEPLAIAEGADFPTKIIAVDMDGDFDLLIRRMLSNYPDTDAIMWSENTDGRGTFAPLATLMDKQDYPRVLIWNERERNQGGELITLTESEASVLFRFWAYDSIAHGLRKTRSLAAGRHDQAVFGDFNLDGHTDVVQTTFSPKVWIHLSKPDGSWSERQWISPN